MPAEALRAAADHPTSRSKFEGLPRTEANRRGPASQEAATRGQQRPWLPGLTAGDLGQWRAPHPSPGSSPCQCTKKGAILGIWVLPSLMNLPLQREADALAPASNTPLGPLTENKVLWRYPLLTGQAPYHCSLHESVPWLVPVPEAFAFIIPSAWNALPEILLCSGN